MAFGKGQGRALNRSNKMMTVIIGVPFILWCWWMLESSYLSHRVFIKEDAPDALIVITVSSVIGLFFAWRHLLRGEAYLFSNETLLKTFIFTFVFSALTFWSVPEAWIRWTAREVITREVKFRIEHPGPAIGRNSHCEAGLRFYDDWLKYYVELCTKDKYLVSDARAVEIEKRVTAHGAYFVRYRFISADGKPHSWIKV